MAAIRTGKREREARNLSKRCRVTIEIDGVVRTLKLGRKKCKSLSRSDSLHKTGNCVVYDYMTPARLDAPWAVPVADAESQPKRTKETGTYPSR